MVVFQGTKKDRTVNKNEIKYSREKGGLEGPRERERGRRVREVRFILFSCLVCASGVECVSVLLFVCVCDGKKFELLSFLFFFFHGHNSFSSFFNYLNLRVWCVCMLLLLFVVVLCCLYI